MLQQINSDRILFIDIETVPQYYTFEELSPEMQQLWADKTRFFQQREEKTPDEVYERAGVYAEFGKVVCISMGYLHHTAGEKKFRVTSFSGKDERVLLEEFADLMSGRFSGSNYLLCGHNIKEFDIPYLCRRMLVLGIPLPDLLDLSGKKPWEVPHLDTLELWKFGDYKHYTSLNLLTHIFGIPTPKDDISGADVARVYYEEDDLEKIVRYCEKDVLAVAQLLLRMKGEPPIAEKNVVVV
ncbi:MAG: 3'-5' exonuclease [Cryomorphaceae bacterium]|nr:MAG: 3'-5' exonuclease [Cryomorphaceae bacterium]